MAFIYDIPYMKNPKKGDLALQICVESGWSTLNYSSNLSYLKGKMKAHRKMSGAEHNVIYRIVDENEKVYFSKEYGIGEEAQTRQNYNKPVAKKINFVEFGEDGLYIIEDEEGNNITDVNLLYFLYDFRFYNIIPCMIDNKTLTHLATNPPTNKSEFIAIYGMGEKKYDKCGELFIEAINNFAVRPDRNTYMADRQNKLNNYKG